MFTGIVTDIGRIGQVKPLNEGVLLRVETSYDPETIEIGASISCSGVCLTVTTLPEKRIECPLVRGRGLGRSAAAYHHCWLEDRNAHQS